MSTQGRSVSSAIPSLTSAMTSLPPAPPASSSHLRPEHIQKRTTSSGSTYSGSGIPNPDPIVISNKDIMSMFSQVKEQLRRVERSNEILKKDMENLRTRADIPTTQVTTPFRSRILDFDTPPSSGYQGDFIAMQGSTRIPDPVYVTGISTSRDQGQIPGSSFGTPMGGNVSTGYPAGYSIGTNILQDPGVSPIMARELQKLKDMISSVPGVVQPIPEVAPTAHRISRFAPPICDAEIPKKFHTPSMKLYDGTTDPEKHIAQY